MKTVHWAYYFQLVAVVLCINEQYIGDSVYEIQTDPKDQEQADAIQQFVASNKLDVWKEYDSGKGNCMIQVPKAKQLVLETLCKSKKMGATKKINDVKEMIDENLKQLRPKYERFDYKQYNRYNAMVNELKRLIVCYYRYMQLAYVGRSSQGRQLVIVKLTNPSHRQKPIIWIDAGMHAREWISPAAAMSMINRILKDRNSDPNIKKLMDEFEVWIVPMFNPDGYEYSIDVDRMWRKTRTPIKESQCVGIDPNRNFDVSFGGIGSSGDPCSNVYRGTKPEEEPTVKAFANTLRCNKARLYAYFSLHSFFQLLLTPNSYTKMPPVDNEEIKSFAFRYATGIRARFGTPINFGPAPFISIPHSGNAPDFVHDKLRVTNAYIIELRDRGQFGFLLPPNQIEPTALETLDGIMAGVFGIKQVNN